MANPGTSPTPEQSRVASAAVRAHGLLALARAAGVNEFTAARVAAGALAQRATIRAVVAAAEQMTGPHAA
jgi:hypothetical protein